MSRIQKLKDKFYEKPIRNDLTFDEIETLAKHYGCIVRAGGNHMQIVYRPLNRIIPSPRHGKTVKEGYIKQLKELFDLIDGQYKED